MFNNIGFFQHEQEDTNKNDKEDFSNLLYSSKSPSAVWDVTTLDSYVNLIFRKNPIYYINGLFNTISNSIGTYTTSPTINSSILNTYLPGKSLQFSTITQNINHNIDLDINNIISFNFWVKLSTISGTKNIVSITNGPDELFALSIISDELNIRINNYIQTLNTTTSSLDLLTSTLYLINVEISNSDIKVYKNSTLIHTITNTLSYININKNGCIVTIGGNTANLELEGLAILTSVLDSQYLAKLYQSGYFSTIEATYNTNYNASSTTSKPKQNHLSIFNNIKLAGLNIDNNQLHGYKSGGVFSHSNALSAISITTLV